MKLYADASARSQAIDSAAPILRDIFSELPMFEDPEVFASSEGLLRIKLISRALSIDFDTLEAIGHAAHERGASSWVCGTEDSPPKIAVVIQKSMI